MRAVVQKVKEASVSLEGKEISKIDQGLLVFLAVKDTDDDSDLDYIRKKIEKLRIFEDEAGKMNLSLKDVGGEILLVSQFTLYGDVRKGNRPSFTASAGAEKGRDYYEKLVELLRQDGFEVKTGKFQSYMEVSLINAGPVTIQLDSERTY